VAFLQIDRIVQVEYRCSGRHLDLDQTAGFAALVLASNLGPCASADGFTVESLYVIPIVETDASIHGQFAETGP
jgi:hypothetical protein